MPIQIGQRPDHVEKLRQRVARLQALYQRHIAIDDREVFPIVARVLHRAQIEELGREYRPCAGKRVSIFLTKADLAWRYAGLRQAGASRRARWTADDGRPGFVLLRHRGDAAILGVMRDPRGRAEARTIMALRSTSVDDRAANLPEVLGVGLDAHGQQNTDLLRAHARSERMRAAEGPCERVDDAPEVVRSRLLDARSRGTISSGHAAPRSTRSPTDPSRKRCHPRRRLDPRTTRSAFFALACSTIVRAGSPCCSTVRTGTPSRSARSRRLARSLRRSLCCHENG